MANATGFFSEKRKWPVFTYMSLLLLLQMVVISGASLFISDEWSGNSGKAQFVYQDLQLAELALGGLNEQEAAQRLQSKVNKVMQSQIELTSEEKSFYIDPAKIDLRYNLEQTLQEAKQRSQEMSGIYRYWNALFGEAPSPYLSLHATFDRAKLEELVEQVARNMDRPAVSAYAEVTGKTIAVIPEKVGYRLIVQKTVEQIAEELQNPKQMKVPLYMEQSQPQLTAKSLEGVDTLLAEQVTVIDPSAAKRLKNIQRASSLINKTLVLPGEVFTFNGTASPYRKENGYEPVPILEDDQIPDGMGGGITQVASTLYAAAIKCGLPVVERHNSRRPVGFLPPGYDAFVRDGDLDLRFVNRTDKAIYIHTELTGNHLRVAIFGAQSVKREVTIETQKLESFPPETIVRKDSNMPFGSEKILRIGDKGLRVKVFAVSKGTDGKLIRKQVSDDFYKPLHNIVVVGPKREDAQNMEGAQSLDDPGLQQAPPSQQANNAAPYSPRPADIPAQPGGSGSLDQPATSGSSASPSSGGVRIENGVIIIGN